METIGLGFGLALKLAELALDSGVIKPSTTEVRYFEEIHLENVKEYERRLISLIRAPQTGSQFTATDSHDNLHDLLHRYCEAVDDFEKMATKPRLKLKHRDSPPLSGTTIVGMRWEEEERKARSEGFLSSIVEIFISFLFALTGGLALIIPMIIMVLSPSRKTSLITTCIFVFAFAVALALYSTIILYLETHLKSRGDLFKGSRIQGKDILAATAAYAAVLVVFVGTSTSTVT